MRRLPSCPSQRTCCRRENDSPACRRGKGKRLEPSKFEGEQETEGRKRAQADCNRLIVPKTKEEIPDVFLRRLDAHRTAKECLIVPLMPPEVRRVGLRELGV